MEYQRITVDWDHERLKRERLAKLQAQMQERDIGGMYLTEGCHTRYLLDAQVPVGKVFVPVEGELDAFVRGRDIGYIQKQHGSAKKADLPPTEVREADGMKGFARDVSNMMTQHGVAGEKLGIDSWGGPRDVVRSRCGVGRAARCFAGVCSGLRLCQRKGPRLRG